MHIEVDVAGLQRTAPQLGQVGSEVDAVGAGTLPAVGAAAGAVGHPELAAAVGALLDGVNGAVQGAALALSELGRAVEAAARSYATQDASVAATMRPGPQP